MVALSLEPSEAGLVVPCPPCYACAMITAVLGAGGFIGSHLVEYLVSLPGNEVVGADLTQEKLAGIRSPNFRFEKVDLRVDRSGLERLVDRCDVVVNLVAHANPSVYVTRPLETVDLNLFTNLEVVRECVKRRRRLVQFSSAEVYGKPALGESQFREEESDFTYGPVHRRRWIYATAKQLLERMIHAFGQEDELEYTIIRPFNFIGPRLDYLVPAGAVGGPRVFAHFLSALLNGGPIRLVNGGEQRRCFTHIDDATRGIGVILEEREMARNAIFNVGNPENDTTIRDFAALMIRVFEELSGRASDSRIEEVVGEEFYGDGYDDADRVPPSVGALAKLGWHPRHDLMATVRHAMLPYLAEAELLPRST